MVAEQDDMVGVQDWQDDHRPRVQNGITSNRHAFGSDQSIDGDPDAPADMNDLAGHGTSGGSREKRSASSIRYRLNSSSTRMSA
jgi:hypothetical protein